ncbi:T9SS type A sorting domain-containing protein [Flavobacterium sp. CYK-4]|uniref:T9SS type A sorting domain-containing protein n=1 Tax=Flavobacterium lotistagni TaxID=2709660 RepID=UPI00140ABA00|nr:T9SS type A sorting domain-containing protein [Flavobacterium lotistagni]NHM06128.1 T9SS type A sorting domain-containing protein [Flavobacterium lotistagni]
MKAFGLLMLLLTSVSFAQDSRLFENQWYLTNLILNANENIPPFNNMGITFYQENSNLDISDACNSLFGFTEFPSNNVSDFSFTASGQTLLDCMDRIGFEQLYFGFFSENNTLTNNFTYTILELENEKILVINSELNNQAVYSTQMLSTNQYQKLNLNISPNPVTDYINIKLDEPIIGKATIKIYNSIGKLCQKQGLNTNQETINIEKLLSGIYLIIFENGKEITTKKFIKR